MSKKGRIFIISAPSGCGKTTLGSGLLNAGLGLNNSISMTTRPRRPGEEEGKDYYFVPQRKFQRLIRGKKFFEWTKTYGWYYGTPKKAVMDLLKKGKDVLLSIDVKGAMNVRRLFADTVLIFIMPPSINELKQRLNSRASDGKKEIEKRLRIVKKEISYAGKYDYNVVNDRIVNAISKLKAIVLAERCKVK